MTQTPGPTHSQESAPTGTDPVGTHFAGARSFIAAIAAFAVVMLGTTLPTPLYSIYAKDLGFGVTTTTIIFAVYAAGVIVALICFGRWSDILGRRPLLIAGAILSAISGPRPSPPMLAAVASAGAR
ncbi:MFS transporter [Gordonia sp. 852002-10350_SCH5691597]|uniref:MFS transporter n=1 Tax=Gordonia sp. 852002-10350_SCH5691597 TaxID=1834085 RepID=UPI0026CFA9D3